MPLAATATASIGIDEVSLVDGGRFTSCRRDRLRCEFAATLPAIVNNHVENFAPGTYRFRARYTRRNTSCAKSSATSGCPVRCASSDTSRV